MPRYLLVGDIHLADRPPASCTESYTDDLFALLEQTVELEEALQCDATIWAGDVFHVKAASRNSHRLVQRAIDLGTRYREWWIAPGNHDLENDRLESLSKQPLGTLYKSGAKMLDRKIGPPNVVGVPWQQDWTTFQPHELAPDQLVVAHAPLYPAHDRPPHDEYISMEWWARHQRAGYVYYGHVHELHGVTPISGTDDTGEYRVTFCNQGALTRGSLAEYDVRRKVAVTVWDPDGMPMFSDGQFGRIELIQKPAEEVFRMVEIGEDKERRVRLDSFVEQVGGTVVTRVTESSVVEAARSKLSPQGVQLVSELLDGVS